jgi:thiamine biosynthesis lipoprotein ApbE
MKRYFFLLIPFIALVACQNDPPTHDHQAIEYQVENNEYGVVIVQGEGVDDAEAKRQALQRAAQLAQKNNYRYFEVVKEEKVQVASTNNSAYSNPSMPSNMYYDLIQSDNFGRDGSSDQNLSQTGLYPAYRIIFRCYQEKPSSDAIDSCTLVDCSK